jgi:hypothetical protein
MVMGTARLRAVSDCNANYSPALLSERAPYMKKQELVRSRSQWPRGLRHELSSPAPTLGSWVRIPMFVCVLCVCIISELKLLTKSLI